MILSGWYFIVISHRYLWSNPSMCFSFNHNIPSLSTNVSMPFLFFNVFGCPICELIKALEIRTYIVFNLPFPNNFFLSWLFFFYNWVILFNSCSDCTNFYFYCRTCNTYGNSNDWSKCRNWNTTSNCWNQNKQVFNII